MTSWPAYCATLLVVAALAFANLDGYHNELFGKGDLEEEPPTINWTHGWPYCFLIRRSPWKASDPSPRPSLFSDGYYVYGRWPFDGAPVTRFWPRPLAIDAGVAAVLVIGTFLSSNRLASKLKIKPQFGLKALFGLTAAIGIFLSFGLPLVLSIKSRHLVHSITVTVLAVAAAAIVVWICEIMLRGLWSLAHCSRPTSSGTDARKSSSGCERP